MSNKKLSPSDQKRVINLLIVLQLIRKKELTKKEGGFYYSILSTFKNYE